MTPQDIVKEISCIKEDNKTCMSIISSQSTKEQKAEYRARLAENNHQLMHLESILASIKYDPLF